MPWQQGDDWVSRWMAIAPRLHDAGIVGSEPLGFALLSYVEAMRSELIEFRLPTFVRAAECILAVPKNGGKPVFVERALKVASAVASHWWLGQAGLEDSLRQLYEHRNDCVHGKVPFLALRAAGEAGADEAARFECLAEVVAREAILFALSSPAFITASTDRASLENAWAAKTIA